MIWWIKKLFVLTDCVSLRRRGLSWLQVSRRTIWRRCWTQQGYVEQRRPDETKRTREQYIYKKKPKLRKEKNKDWNARLISADFEWE